MLSTSVNSTHAAAEAYAVIDGMDEDALEVARRSRGWSVVAERTVRAALEAGAEPRAVLEALDAWAFGHLVVSDDPVVLVAAAVYRGLFRAVQDGRIPDAASFKSERAFTDATAAIQAMVGAAWEDPRLRATLALADLARHVFAHEAKGRCRAAWEDVCFVVSRLAADAYDVGGEPLCRVLVETLRGGARRSPSSVRLRASSRTV